MQEIGPFCDTSAAEDINTTWVCSGKNAEDMLNGVIVPNPRHEYFVLAIGNDNAEHPNSDNIVDRETGLFDPTACSADLGAQHFCHSLHGDCQSPLHRQLWQLP